MDRSLADRLNDLWKQSDVLKSAEEAFLRLEAERKPLFSMLFLKAEGKSVADREAVAYNSSDWADFVAGHVAAETAFNYERRKFEILEKAYLAEHATYKIDDRSIRKAGA